jgi:hypothetical protein
VNTPGPWGIHKLARPTSGQREGALYSSRLLTLPSCDELEMQCPMHPPTEAAIEPSTSTGPESLGTVRVTVTSDGRLPVFNMAQADASGPALPDCQAPLCDHWQTRMGASMVMVNRRRRKGMYTGSGWADSAPECQMARPGVPTGTQAGTVTLGTTPSGRLGSGWCRSSPLASQGRSLRCGRPS